MNINHILYAVPEVPGDIEKSKRIDWLTENLKKFCTLPWLNLNTNPNGNIKLCCNIQMDHFVAGDGGAFNLGYHHIDDIWNSMYMDNVRRLHRQNNGSNECIECYKIERISGHSPRMGQNVMWINKKDQDTDLSDFLAKVSEEELYAHLDQLPVSLELRLGNQCNLKCITCWGMSSSLIQTERLDIINKGILKEYNLGWLDSKWREETAVVEQTKVTEWYETDIFYENFRKMAPRLKRLYTTGGEPTVIKANYRMLEMLLEAGNKTCSIEFTSNMTTWNQKFYDALSQFENVEIQMSIDGVDDVAEYIRYPTNFKVVRENMHKAAEMASKNPGWRIKSYTVLQALNYKHLVPVWELINELATTYDKHIDWWPITLASPPYLSLSTVPLEERLAYLPTVLEEAKRFEDVSKPFCLSEGTIGAYTDSVRNTAYDEFLNQQFKQYVTFLDDYRAKDAK
jgi:sulfatase maturation enzyme AslB (radical SAM superfamily)